MAGPLTHVKPFGVPINEPTNQPTSASFDASVISELYELRFIDPFFVLRPVPPNAPQEIITPLTSRHLTCDSI